MTRPAIIIGLGGTGQWVLTFVKKDLLEVGRGQLPKNVALLAFDTMPQATAETERQGGEREVKVGSVKLETDKEFIHVGGNVFDLAQKIRAGQYPHIGSWFQADHYLRSLPPASFNLSEGAGQIRQFGRLAIFHDLSQPAESRIWPYVYSAVQSVRSSVTDESSLEVIIVGSFAGGTGAGMFIDMALLLRAIATDAVAGNHIVRGFFVLPRAFPVMAGRRQTEMFARTFAAWRELNRFMIVDPALGLRRMIYNERNRDFQIPVEKRVYDVCYLIDAVSGRGSLATRNPEEGIFPSIADAIGAILDDQAGKKYTEHVTSNLSRAFNNHPGQPMFSTMGTYSVKVPVYYVQQEFAHQLSLKVLERILTPVRDDRGRVVQLLPNANPENPGRAGAEEVYGFLERTSFSRAGEDTVYNTLFLPKVAELMKADADNKPDMQKVWAEASLHARKGAAPVGWLVPLTRVGDSPEALALRNEIDRTINLALVTAVPPSRIARDKPAEAVNRLRRQIAQFRVEQVGVKDASQRDLISRGNFGKALEKCKAFQVSVFRRMLRLWLLNTLEGQVEDPLIARTGKLGYVDSFLTELVNVLDRFLTFMRKVKKVREDSGLANRIAQDINTKEKAYIARATKPGILAPITKADYDAQEAYLLAEQRAVDLRQDEILHEVVEETAQAMLDIARRTRDDAKAWIAALALSPDSVLARVNSSLDDVRIAHKKDADLSNVQRIVAEEALDVTEDMLRDALSRFHWNAEWQDGRLAITATLQMKTTTDLRGAARESVEALLSYGRERFPAYQDKAVALELYRSYEGDAKQIAASVDKKAEPLTRVGGDGPEERHCYIRVHSDINERVRTTFDDMLKALKETNKGVSMNLVESEDPFKLTVVRSNDMIKPEDFTAWEECRTEYQTLIHDEPDQAVLLQTFPAEVTAAKYERKLEKLRAHWRIFHPRVVMLLESEERVRQFLQAWAFGFIRQERDARSGRTYYELNIPGSRSQPVHLTDPEKPFDIFTLMNQFLLRGEDVRSMVRQPIRYDWLADAIRAEQVRLGNHGTADVYQEQIVNGLVKDLRDRAEQLNYEKAGSGQAFSDLADLAELMLSEMAADLRS